MRDDLINRWSKILAVLALASLGWFVGFAIGQRVGLGSHRRAIRAVDVAWEVCREVEGRPVYHEHGGRWIRNVSPLVVPDSAAIYGNWVWVDAAGKFVPWPGPEDDGVDDGDACGEAVLAGYDAATEEGR